MIKSPDLDYIKVAKEHILRPGWEFGEQSTTDAYNRLFSRPDAVLAWQKLWSVEFLAASLHGPSIFPYSKNSSWFEVMHEFGDCFRLIALPVSRKITSAQIRKSANDAAKRARELAHMINDHFNLEAIDLKSCLSSTEVSAYEEASKIYGKEFRAGKTEDRFDSNFHYRTIQYQFLEQDMKDILWRFAIQAEKTSNQLPISSRPNNPEVGAKLFCIGICQIFEWHYGQPLIEISAAFVSATLDKDFSNETVKSWWQRRSRDY